MALPPFEIERFLAQHESASHPALGTSDIEPIGMRELLAMADPSAWELWDATVLGYPPGNGLLELRAEIATLYPGLDADDICVFGGAQEALFVLAQVAIEAEDHVVVVTPAFQSLLSLPAERGAHITELPLEYDQDWVFRLEHLQAAMSPRTKTIVWNFPHNPTGALPGRDDYELAMQMADSRGVRVISDETYRFLEMDPKDALAPAACLSSRAVSIGTLSKTFGAAGLRIGWVATRDRPLLQKVEEYKGWVSIASPGPAQTLALIAIRERERIMRRSRTILTDNTEILEDFLDGWDTAFECVMPRAGTTAFPRLTEAVPVRRFAEELVRETGVVIAPGHLFGDTGNHFRIGLGRHDMGDSLHLLDRFANRWLTRVRV